MSTGYAWTGFPLMSLKIAYPEIPIHFAPSECIIRVYILNNVKEAKTMPQLPLCSTKLYL